MQLRDAGFAAPLAVMDQLDHRLPHSFDLLGGSSAADFQFRALRGPLALGAFRPIPSIKITGSDNTVLIVVTAAVRRCPARSRRGPNPIDAFFFDDGRSLWLLRRAVLDGS